MSNLEAARVRDAIDSNFSVEGALAGALVGVAITALIKFPVAQLVNIGRFPLAGGALRQAIFRAWSASVKAARSGVHAAPGQAIEFGAESLGEALGRQIAAAGPKIVDGSNDVFINLRKAARILDPVEDGSKIAEGSETVIVNERPAARRTDKTDQGGAIFEGSRNVLMAGPKTTQVKIAASDRSLAGEVALGAAGGLLTSALKGTNPVKEVIDGADGGLKGWLFNQVLGPVKNSLGF